MVKKEPSALLVGLKIDSDTIKTVWFFFKKLKRELPFDQRISLLGIFYKTKTFIPKDICTSMFMAELFKIAKIWK